MELDLSDRVQRFWPVRWVNRGGGCWFQTPGQLAVYPILPLQRLGLPVYDYLRRLQSSLLLLVREFGMAPHAVGADVFVSHRPIACVGAAVRDWTTYFGAIVNVNPDLLPFRYVRTGRRHPPMTSLQRECRRPFRPGHVRERLIEHLVAQLGLGEALYFTSHPALSRKAFVDAITAAR
jgi:lipoyl(octanoyl) transferase